MVVKCTLVVRHVALYCIKLLLLGPKRKVVLKIMHTVLAHYTDKLVHIYIAMQHLEYVTMN